VTRARAAIPASLAGAAVAGAVVTVALRGGTPAPAAAKPPPVSTATVTRTNLVTTVLTAGTLGYAPTRPVVNQLTGTYTWLPPVGSKINPGQVLYRVDDLPVVLMRGRVPAWRPFVPGMTGGPDVRQLQAGLIAEGYAGGLFSDPTGQFDPLTVDAVERWQTAHGFAATGQITLGQVVFLPTAIRVGPPYAAPGQVASPGEQPYPATTSRRVVTVLANPDLPTVHAGERVSIELPSNTATPGRVTAIGAVPQGGASTAGPGGSGGGAAGAAGTGSGSGGTGQAAASAVITIRPRRPGGTGTGEAVPVQVAIPSQEARGVLAVPVSALEALAGGGYGVEVVTGSGGHVLVGVRTGLFAGGRVAISGAGVHAGTQVVTAQ
jgi:peptidoglycan hydrolase-like protein with peptidoglycan-binding domain